MKLPICSWPLLRLGHEVFVFDFFQRRHISWEMNPLKKTFIFLQMTHIWNFFEIFEEFKHSWKKLVPTKFFLL